MTRTLLFGAIVILSLGLMGCASNGEEPELPDSPDNPSMNSGPIGTSDYIYRNPVYPAATRGATAHGK